jgi:DNA-binding transcriptional ArsR family regulator
LFYLNLLDIYSRHDRYIAAMNSPTLTLIEALRRYGPESASALARRLEVSTPTVTRALKRLGDAVTAIGKGRASSYALRRDVRDIGYSWPLYRVRKDGTHERLGMLEALHGRYRWRLVPDKPLPLFMRDEFADGLYEDLPWFLQALRPQGYLGREQTKGFAQTIGAPEDINLWQAEDILCELVIFSIDLPGNLIIGEKSQIKIDIYNQTETLFYSQFESRMQHFRSEAEASENRAIPGSSAAGERPKFIAPLCLEHGEKRSAIVKFSPLVQGNPTAQRWADLLICEEIALHLLREHDIPAADTEILDAGEWRFLQSTRFDRTSQGGRIGVFALDALDMAYIGSDQRDWLAGAEPFHAQGMLSVEDLETVRLLVAFGRCIGNDDMHHGNLSFFAEPDIEALRLAPVYDMLPMHYRPSPNGLVRDAPFTLPAPDPTKPALWTRVAMLAEAYWTRAAEDGRLSDGFATICRENAARLTAWRLRHGI